MRRLRRIGNRKRTPHCLAQRVSVLAWITLWFSFAPSSVWSAESPKARIVGLGATRCGQFSADVVKNPAVQRDYLAWAQGFMSGILISRPAGVDEGLDLIPSTFPLLKQVEFLREYCWQHSDDSFSDAVVVLYKRLRREGAT